MNADAEALEQEVVRLAAAGEHAKALAAAEALERRFPDASPDAAHLQACLLARMGRTDDALHRLETALENGHLWRPRRLDDPDLAPLHEDARFEALRAAAAELARRRRAEPRLLTALSERPNAPLLLVFHGATSTAAVDFEQWRGAAALGYGVAALQSSQRAGPDTFCWDDPGAVHEDVRWALTQLPRHGRIVLAGFSQGARVALRLALEGAVVQPGGAVLVAPSLVEPPPPAARRLRIAVVAGADDPYLARSQPALDLLGERGHHLSVEIVAGLGHAYPRDFGARVPALLAAVTRTA